MDQLSQSGGTKTVQGLKKSQRVCPCNKRTGGRIFKNQKTVNERLTNKGMREFPARINEPAVA